MTPIHSGWRVMSAAYDQISFAGGSMVCSVWNLMMLLGLHGIDDRQRPAMTVPRRASAASFATRTAVMATLIGGRAAEVLPPQPKPCAAVGRLEVGGRVDRPQAGHREPPADVVVGLPVDDLLERRESAGHAL